MTPAVNGHSDANHSEVVNGHSDNLFAPKYLAHVVFETPQFKKMVQFYRNLLGAQTAFENDFIAFLSYDDEHHRLAFISNPNLQPRDKGTAGMHHLAFGYESLQKLAEAYLARKELGILPSWCVNHGPTTSFYYEDPDGNRSEHQVDNFDTIEGATAFYNSKFFAENPIGTDFDHEKFVARLNSGESETSIKTRVEIGARTEI